MIDLFTPAQVRAADERTIAGGTPSLDLMERAAGHLARAVLSGSGRRYGLRVVALCGKGNNGGDGVAAARRLCEAGADARVYLVAGEDGLSHDGRAQLARFRAVGGRVLATLDLAETDVAIDCMLGTGASGPAREPVTTVIDLLDARRREARPFTVVACDLPSGVDADTGQVPGEAVTADLTVTIGAAKRGLYLSPARSHCGELRVADIGLVRGEDPPVGAVLEPADVRDLVSVPRYDVDKRGRGVVVLLAGSDGMAGAAIMAARGALSMGTGLLTLATSEHVRDVVAPTVPEAMTLGLPDGDPDAAFGLLVDRLDGADALGIGPGLGRSQATATLVKRLVKELDLPIVLDADGLNAFRGDGDALADRAGGDLICTPHAREFARLLGAKTEYVGPERVHAAAQAARRWRATVVLKGPGTIIEEPQGATFINPTGSAALATGGTGDVLTGMLTATLSSANRTGAVAAAVYVHGLAGEIAARRLTTRSVAALDVAAAVPAALASLEVR